MSKYIFLAAILFTCIRCTRDHTNKPNFLLIIVDDLGWRDLGCTGSSMYETPNIDALSAQGIHFINGYSNSPVCSPARASIFTGMDIPSHGITEWIGGPSLRNWDKDRTQLIPPDYPMHLPFENITLAEALKENGYRTFFAGKWHLGGAADNSLPTDHGFDMNKGGYHRGGPYSGGYFSPFNNPYLEDHPSEKGISLSQKLAVETNQFISNNKDSSFLAVLSFYAVHAPIQTSQEKWDKYRTKMDSIGIVDSGFTMERILPMRMKQDNPVYAGLVEQVDDAVGLVIENLKSLGLFHNTVIFFTSDNGGVTSGDAYATSNLPLRGGKGYQWEAGTRVPFIISAPVILPNTGMRTRIPAIGMDIFPTILDIANIPTNNYPFLDGKSLLPPMTQQPFENRPLFWHYPHYSNQGGEPSSIVRDGDWKLIYYWEDGRTELYNLFFDAEEQNDIAAQEPAQTALLFEQLNTWLVKTNAQRPIKNMLFDPEAHRAYENFIQQEKLPALESERHAMLKKDWVPNLDWWGSKID